MKEIPPEAILAARKAIAVALWDSPAITVVGHDFKEREHYRALAVSRMANAALTAAWAYMTAPQSPIERFEDGAREGMTK